MRTLGVIPARYASTRFPGKPLVSIAGKSMIQRVYEQASKATQIETCIVATDDKRIFDHVSAFGGQVAMTRLDHKSGTDRCAEVAAIFADFDLVINIQGDEPFVNPTQIDQLVLSLKNNSAAEIATLAKQIQAHEELFNPNVVKVVFNKRNEALYFSRSTIPYLRGQDQEQWLSKGRFFKHLGLYGYRRSVLLAIAKLLPGRLEQLESLEQLRWLEEGYRIRIEETKVETIGIDSPEDLERTLKLKKL